MRRWSSWLGCAQRHWMHSGAAKWGAWFSSLYAFHLSPDVIPPFSPCFLSRCGQEASATTLHHWDHAVVVLTTLHHTFSQCPLLERRPRLPPWFLQGPTTNSWPYLGLERRGRLHPRPGKSEGCSLCDQACFGATAPPHCKMALEGCLQMGISTCCQNFGWRNIAVMPCHEAAASCQKTATAFILPLRYSGLGKKYWVGHLQLEPNSSEVFIQPGNRFQKPFLTSRKRGWSCTVVIFPYMKSHHL